MPYTIHRVFGSWRADVEAYIAEHHYMRSAGGSGQLFAVLRDGSQVAGACLIGATSSANQTRSLITGACLIGPAASQDAEQSIARPGVLVRQIKRSILADDVPMSELCESQLLRHAMHTVCDEYDQPTLFVSYADPAAIDLRTGLPLAGGCLLAAGFFYIGETTSRRRCVIDHLGRARSTRQGAVTLTAKTLPRAGEIFHGEDVTADWRMANLPSARIWIVVCTPSRMSRRQAKTAWRRRLVAGTVPIGEPRPQHMRLLDHFQPAFWNGSDITRTAAPIWVPLVWQHRILLLDEDEHTDGRTYAPLRDSWQV